MAVQYAGSRLFRRWRGRVVYDIPLPGDEEYILNTQIRRAQIRDEGFSPDELEVYLCMRYRLKRATAYCINFVLGGCDWCGKQWVDNSS